MVKNQSVLVGFVVLLSVSYGFCSEQKVVATPDSTANSSTSSSQQVSPAYTPTLIERLRANAASRASSTEQSAALDPFMPLWLRNIKFTGSAKQSPPPLLPFSMVAHSVQRSAIDDEDRFRYLGHLTKTIHDRHRSLKIENEQLRERNAQLERDLAESRRRAQLAEARSAVLLPASNAIMAAQPSSPAVVNQESTSRLEAEILELNRQLTVATQALEDRDRILADMHQELASYQLVFQEMQVATPAAAASSAVPSSPSQASNP